MTPNETKAAVIARFRTGEENVDRPTVLYDPKTKRYCPQGDILHTFGGWSNRQLMRNTQLFADTAVAKLLGITRFESAIIRHLNDNYSNDPFEILDEPMKHLGPEWESIVAVARTIEDMPLTKLQKAWKKAFKNSMDDVDDLLVNTIWTTIGFGNPFESSSIIDELNEVIEDVPYSNLLYNCTVEIIISRMISPEQAKNEIYPYLGVCGFKNPQEILNR